MAVHAPANIYMTNLQASESIDLLPWPAATGQATGCTAQGPQPACAQRVSAERTSTGVRADTIPPRSLPSCAPPHHINRRSTLRLNGVSRRAQPQGNAAPGPPGCCTPNPTPWALPSQHGSPSPQPCTGQVSGRAAKHQYEGAITLQGLGTTPDLLGAAKNGAPQAARQQNLANP